MLEDEVNEAHKEMMKHSYRLHSIYVHDGSAESGHYFTFIYDRHQQKWRKYNDVHVSEVSEEVVFKISEGGFKNSSAYWVVYVDEEVAQNTERIDFNLYQPPQQEIKSDNIR